MISFIIIGKNEARFLKKCFTSIERIVNSFTEIYLEIIYVDSDSSDNSIELAQKYAIKVIKISGDINAAIARNIGAKHASGDYFIFLDGDMEIELDFFKYIIDEKEEPIHDYVSGDIINIFHDSNGHFINSGYYYGLKLTSDKDLPYTGGFFCIRKSLWDMIGGMKEKYRRSQDLDMGFRLSKKGILILRKKELGVKHNTISYFDKKRMWKILLKNDFGYRAVLYRDHILNPYIYKLLLRTDYTMIFLVILIITSIISGHYWFLTIYFLFSFFRALAQSRNDKVNAFQKFIFITLKDIQLVFSFLFFHPRKRKQYLIKNIK